MDVRVSPGGWLGRNEEPWGHGENPKKKKKAEKLTGIYTQRWVGKIHTCLTTFRAISYIHYCMRGKRKLVGRWLVQSQHLRLIRWKLRITSKPVTAMVPGNYPLLHTVLPIGVHIKKLSKYQGPLMITATRGKNSVCHQMVSHQYLEKAQYLGWGI